MTTIFQPDFVTKLRLDDENFNIPYLADFGKSVPKVNNKRSKWLCLCLSVSVSNVNIRVSVLVSAVSILNWVNVHVYKSPSFNCYSLLQQKTVMVTMRIRKKVGN